MPEKHLRLISKTSVPGPKCLSLPDPSSLRAGSLIIFTDLDTDPSINKQKSKKTLDSTVLLLLNYRYLLSLKYDEN
jgi:hypothetical protein